MLTPGYYIRTIQEAAERNRCVLRAMLRERRLALLLGSSVYVFVSVRQSGTQRRHADQFRQDNTKVVCCLGIFNGYRWPGLTYGSLQTEKRRFLA